MDLSLHDRHYDNEPDEFYMVLPSNGCPLSHPNNNAANFINSWDTPIILKDTHKWQVALIEVNMTYPKYALSRGLSLYYKGLQTLSIPICVQSMNLNYDTHGNFKGFDLDEQSRTWRFDFNVGPHVLTWLPPSLSYEKMSEKDGKGDPFYRIRIKTNKGKFKINFQNLVNFFSPRMRAGVMYESTPSKDYHYFDIEFLEKEKGKSVQHLEFHFFHDSIQIPIYNELRVEKTYSALTEEELCVIIGKVFIDVIKSCEILPNDKMKITFRKGTSYVEFRGLLHHVLGFPQHKYEFNHFTNENSIEAEMPPSLNKGVPYVYIYSSVSEPIHVGGVMVPLLRSVWFDGKTQQDLLHGQIINHVIQHLMYVPVCQSTINSIEINIRTDSGEFVPFAGGSVTSLTLHFRKKT